MKTWEMDYVKEEMRLLGINPRKGQTRECIADKSHSLKHQLQKLLREKYSLISHRGEYHSRYYIEHYNM